MTRLGSARSTHGLVAAATALLTGLAVIASSAGPAMAMTPHDEGGDNVTGVVRTPSGDPFTGTFTIDAVDANNHVLDTTVTHSGNGGYGVTLPAGSYVVRALPTDTNPTPYAPGSAQVTVPAGASTTANIALATANLSGTVYSPAGDPVPGVQVEIPSSVSAPDIAFTNSDGKYALHEAPNFYGVTADVPADEQGKWTTGGTTADLTEGSVDNADITFETVDVSGTVETPDGTPVSGSQVDIYHSDGSVYETSAAITNSDGTFGVNVGPGDYELRARPTSTTDAYSPGTATVTVPATGAAPPVTVTLTKPDLAGVVYAPDGTTPVGDIGVDITPESDTTDQLDYVTTDSTGHYHFHVPTGSYRVYAHPDPGGPGVTTWADNVAVTDGDTTTQDITLQQPNLVGHVYSPGSPAQPVAASQVTVEDSHGQPVETGNAQTATDGSYAVRVPAGTYTVVADPPYTNPDHLSTASVDNVVVPDSGSKTQDVTLTAPTVSGRVLSSDGYPQAWASLSVYDVTANKTLDLNPSTDGNGGYGIALPLDHTYRITASPTNSASDQRANAITVKLGDTALTGEDIRFLSASSMPWQLVKESLDPNGQPLAADSDQPAISGDGNHVVFESVAPGVTDDPPSTTANSQSDVYERNLVSGTTHLVSKSLTGTGGNDNSRRPVVDDDGGVVAFVSDASDLVSGDDNEASDVFVRTGGQTLALSTDPGTGQQSVGESDNPTIDGDGTHVAFVGQRTYDDPSSGNIYVATLDATPGVVSLVPVTSLTSSDTDSVALPSLSKDGSTLAYYRYRADKSQWFLEIYDVATGTTTEGPAVDPRDPGDNLSGRGAPSLTAHGDTIVYSAFDGDGNGTPMSYDVASSQASKLPLFSWGDPQTSSSSLCHGATDPQISADGSTLAFTACAPDAPPFDVAQLWTRDLTSSKSDAELVTASTSGGDSYVTADDGGFSSDGKALVLASDANDLFASDADSTSTPTAVILAHNHTDTVPPAWPAGATLSASDVGRQVMTLTWPTATDDSGVTSYQVFQDGTKVADIAAPTTTYTVTGLTPDHSYTFAVQAVDRFDNASTDGPALTQKTLASVAGNGTAFLAATAEPGGKVALLWDGAAAGTYTAYRVYRSTGSGSPVKVADVDPDKTSYTDSGLAAATTYTYQIYGVSGSDEAPYTKPAAVATPALSALTLTATTPLLSPGLAKLGDAVTLTAVGDPGRTVTASANVMSWFDGQGKLLAAPAPSTVAVTLTEDPAKPGHYSGTLPLSNGTSQVTAISAALTDGAGHDVTADAAGFPVDVSGAVAATIDSPDQAFPGGRLTFNDEQTWAGVDRTLTDDSLVSVPLAPAASDSGYTADLFSTIDGQEASLAQAEGVIVKPGLSTPLTLTARYPATVTVDYSGPGANVAGTTVTATDQNGNPVSWGNVDPQSSSATLGNLTSGGTVTVHTDPAKGLQVAAPKDSTVTLKPGDNALDVALTALPPAHVAGTVLAPDGTGADGAIVTVTQTVDNRSWSFSGTAAKDGSYDVAALAGTGATVSAAYHDETQHQAADLPASGVDFQMTAPSVHIVGVDLETKQPGSSSYTKLSVDGRTAFHFQLGASTPTGQSGPDQFGADGGSDVTIVGRATDTVTLCGNGAAAGLPDRQVCTSATLGDAADPPTLTLKLSSDGTLHGTVKDGAGNNFDGGYTTVVTHHTASGTETVPTGYSWGHDLSLPVDGDGTYDVTVIDANDPTRTATASATVSNGGVGDLGDLTLTGGKWFGSDSTITPSTATVDPGGIDDIRVVLTNAASDVTGAVLRVVVPSPATVPTDGITVDGAPVTDATSGDGYVDIPLGDIAAGKTVTVHYPIDSGSATPAAPLAAKASIRFSADGNDQEEYLTPQTITVTGVSIDVPQSITQRSLVASGRAPAGDTVQVYDGGMDLGSATASPGGYWTLPVALSDRGTPATYVMYAQTTHDGTPLRSAATSVFYDPDQPELTSVSVYQIDQGRPDGRKFTFDPRQGEARFPFVFVPGQPLVIEGTFSHPDRVSNVVAHAGDNTGPATLVSDGLFRARFDDPTTIGDISFDYDTTPVPITADYQPSKDELQAALPPALANFTATPAQDVNGGFGTDGGGQTTTVTLPSMPKDTDGNPMQLQITLTQKQTTYTPTDQDLAIQQETGVPMWGASQTVNDDGELVITGYVPNTSSGSTGHALAHARFAPRSAVSTAVTEVTETLAKKFANKEDKLGTAFTWATTANTVNNNAPGNNNYDSINQLYDGLSDAATNGCLSDSVVSAYENQISKLKDEQVLFDLAGAGIDLGSEVLAPETLGASLAGFAVGWAFGQVTGAIVNSQIASIQQNLKTAEATFASDCEPISGRVHVVSPNHHSSGTAGGLTPIYDPSGYVYDGVASNRVEGATATVLTGPTANGPWSVWDASDYGQVSPETTNDDGHYGWNVPEGYYTVGFTKDGYAPARSRVVKVLPPHFDVNVGMVPTAAPTVTSVDATRSAITVGFSQYMDPKTITPSTLIVTTSDGTPVKGTLAPTNAETAPAPDGRTLASTYAFTPTTDFTPGEGLTVTVDSLLRNDAGTPLDATYTKAVTVPNPNAGGGGNSGGGSTGGGGGGPTPTPPKTSDSATSSSPTGSATATVRDGSGHPLVTATGSGQGTVTVATYSVDPHPPATFSATGTYVDVSTSQDSHFGDVKIQVCGVQAGNAVNWYDARTGKWQELVPSGTLTHTGDCLSFTLDATSSPSLAQLTGTAFAIATATAPDAPAAVSALGGDGRAVVHWSAPASDNGSPVTGFTVTANPGGTHVTAPANASQATVTGLTNGTTYTFTVIAINAVGTSAPSATSAPVTPAAPTVTPTPTPTPTPIVTSPPAHQPSGKAQEHPRLRCTSPHRHQIRCRLVTHPRRSGLTVVFESVNRSGLARRIAVVVTNQRGRATLVWRHLRSGTHKRIAVHLRATPTVHAATTTVHRVRVK